MRKTATALMGVAVLMLAGLLAWSVQATPLTGGLAPVQKSSSVIEAGCKGPGLFCPWGRHWICPPYRTCWCAPCGAYKRPGGRYRG
jgi:hypothetical protein